MFLFTCVFINYHKPRPAGLIQIFTIYEFWFHCCPKTTFLHQKSFIFLNQFSLASWCNILIIKYRQTLQPLILDTRDSLNSWAEYSGSLSFHIGQNFRIELCIKDNKACLIWYLDSHCRRSNGRPQHSCGEKKVLMSEVALSVSDMKKLYRSVPVWCNMPYHDRG